MLRPLRSDLIYNIAEAQLRGALDGLLIDLIAVSGGRAGTTTPGAENYFLENNPLATHVDYPRHAYGGPIPLGQYWMRRHEPPHVRRIRLLPFPLTDTFRRKDFLIHGQGPIGSQGCIVFSHKDMPVLDQILHLIDLRKRANRSEPVLEVVAIGADLDAKNRTA